MLTDGHTLYVLEYDVKKHTFSISQSRFYKSNEMAEIFVWLLGQLLKVYPHKSLVHPEWFVTSEARYASHIVIPNDRCNELESERMEDRQHSLV